MYNTTAEDGTAEDGTAEDGTAEDSTAEDAAAELFNLGWTLRRSHQILTNYHGRYPNFNRTLTLTLTLTRRSVHGNVSIWWLRRSVHPKLKSSAVASSAVPSSAVVSTAVPSSAAASSAAASGPQIITTE